MNENNMYQQLAKQHLFPHGEFRPQQAKFVAAVGASLAARRNLLVHAPTGLGKTAATLGPAVAYALKEKKTIFFLTSRTTQHTIALKTLHQLQQQHNNEFGVIDLVGKQQLCLQSGVHALSSSEFNSYCKHQREERLCEYYTNARKKDASLDVRGKYAAQQLTKKIIPLEVLKNQSQISQVCPYEIATELAKTATVIVGDYFHLFHDKVRDGLFIKSELELENCIIIVDEMHNLGARVKNQASDQISTWQLQRAIKEAQKVDNELALILNDIYTAIEQYNDQEFDEKLYDKQELITLIDDINEYDDLITKCKNAGSKVRDEKQSSFLLGLANFLQHWREHDKGFTRIIQKQIMQQNTHIVISHTCLDAAVVCQPLFDLAHASVCMSGTAKPMQMYADTLGLTNLTMLELENPFPEENKESIIVPTVSTRYKSRSPESFTKMAQIVSTAAQHIPGNTIVFFPSYDLLRHIGSIIATSTTKTTFTEEPGLSAQQRTELLKKFESYAEGPNHALLLAVSSGSFGEGIDLPGDLLKGVIVVGLPLARPDLLTKELIAYYENKFGRGWDYAYLIPAFNIVTQNAGRCIRTATDKGVVIYLDDRYAGQFNKYFDQKPKVLQDPLPEIQRFFNATATSQHENS